MGARANRLSNVKKSLLGGGAAGSWVILVFAGPAYFHPFSCPTDTLVSGYLGVGNALWLIGAGLPCLGFLLIMAGSPRRRGKRAWLNWRNYRTIGLIGFAATAVGPFMWLDGLFTYYCATPRAIVVHPDPLEEPVTYAWSDVSRVSTRCYVSRTRYPEFNLDMRDGRRVALGGDTWLTLAKNYAEIGAALAPVPYVYDNHSTDHCPSFYRQLFAKRPG